MKKSTERLINGGFCARQTCCEYIENDNMPFEQEPRKNCLRRGLFMHINILPLGLLIQLESLNFWKTIC